MAEALKCANCHISDEEMKSKYIQKGQLHKMIMSDLLLNISEYLDILGDTRTRPSSMGIMDYYEPRDGELDKLDISKLITFFDENKVEMHIAGTWKWFEGQDFSTMGYKYAYFIPRNLKLYQPVCAKVYFSQVK